jgi:GR25 family glycosyltransferase involved in LPS biosynthesis
LNRTALATGARVGAYRAMSLLRRLLGPQHVRAFRPGAISRVLVINLDRQDSRWRDIRRELAAIRGGTGAPLHDRTTRLSAVDARYLAQFDASHVRSTYTLADQLFVDPQPIPINDPSSLAIQMSDPEIAVALSHLQAWSLVANGDDEHTLILEDDVFFHRRFGRDLDRAWDELYAICRTPDLVFLGYSEAESGAAWDASTTTTRVPQRGIWQLSAYVLSRSGAQELLNRRPIIGPVDLWMNHQFATLDVVALRLSRVDQRPDLASGNSYSVLPVLSKVGLVTSERAPTIRPPALEGPLIITGAPGSGVSSVVEAVSMLGYRCCSDLDRLPSAERQALFAAAGIRTFDAYSNIGTLTPESIRQLATIHSNLDVVVCTGGVSSDAAEMEQLLDALTAQRTRVLEIPAVHQDRWQLLTEHLGCDYPSASFPNDPDRPQRMMSPTHRNVGTTSRALEADNLPWVVRDPGWLGLRLNDADRLRLAPEIRFASFDDPNWIRRDDTFPSNLAIFRRHNAATVGDCLELTVAREPNEVRELSAGALSTSRSFLHGRVGADLKPTATPGLVTGLFLHRNAPRQEIDIEFPGNDTTRMLANVYFNPGPVGAHLEYGVRGSPTTIDLGFDAASDFHRYEIDWSPTSIQWLVDGTVVHERGWWEPTPIPHRSMEFHINVWPTRSRELAGRLRRRQLPAHSSARNIVVVPFEQEGDPT